MHLQLGIQVNRDKLHVLHMATSEIPTSLSSNVLSHRICVVSFTVHQQDQREFLKQPARVKSSKLLAPKM